MNPFGDFWSSLENFNLFKRVWNAIVWINEENLFWIFGCYLFLIIIYQICSLFIFFSWLQVRVLLRGDEHVSQYEKECKKGPLQRTYSEELLDAQEYNTTKYLSDLNKHHEVAFGSWSQILKFQTLLIIRVPIDSRCFRGVFGSPMEIWSLKIVLHGNWNLFFIL